MTEARIQIRRTKGFVLQFESRALNGLPGRRCARPTLFGNPFEIGKSGRAGAVKSFRRFLRTWPDAQIMRGIKDKETGERDPMAGIGMIVLRNCIRANLHHLRGYNLACFCPIDEPCHCDVYLDLLKTDWPERWKAKYPKICDRVRP